MAEMLDKSIRGSRDFAGVVDSRLVVAIPYISTAGEIRQRKRKIVLLWVILAVVAICRGRRSSLHWDPDRFFLVRSALVRFVDALDQIVLLAHGAASLMRDQRWKIYDKRLNA